MADRHLAVDAGCGNGRNSEWLKSLGYEVLSLDIDSEYGEKYDLSSGVLPVVKADVVLLQFVLMFLPLNAREALVREAFKKTSGIVVVELYQAKTGFMSKDEISEFCRWIEREAGEAGFGLVAREGSKMAFLFAKPKPKGARNEKSVQGSGRKG